SHCSVSLNALSTARFSKKRPCASPASNGSSSAIRTRSASWPIENAESKPSAITITSSTLPSFRLKTSPSSNNVQVAAFDYPPDLSRFPRILEYSINDIKHVRGCCMFPLFFYPVLGFSGNSKQVTVVCKFYPHLR